MPHEVAVVEGPNFTHAGSSNPDAIHSILTSDGPHSYGSLPSSWQGLPSFYGTEGCSLHASAKIVFYGIASRDSLIHTTKTSLKNVASRLRERTKELLNAC